MLLASSIHLRRQGLSSPSEGKGFTLPSEVEGENKVENKNEEEQDEDEKQTIGAERQDIFRQYPDDMSGKRLQP